MTIMEPITNAAMNAVLMTGDYSYLDLPRSQFDLIWSLRKEVDGEMKVPHRHFDSGWADYRPPSARHMIYVWTCSMAEEDLDRILALPRDNDWNTIAIPGVSGKDSLTGRDTKHYIANTLPWFQFIHGQLPNYPRDILKGNLALIELQLKKMRSNTGNPRSWDSYDPATADVVVGLDLRVPGYNIHAWQEFNPIYFEGLAQMLFGAPMHISHGGLQHGKLRYFDGEKSRPGLPEDVSVMVSEVSSDHLRVEVVNLSESHPRSLILQAGSFGENRFDKVTITAEDGSSATHDVNSKWFTVDLLAGAGATLEFTYRRFANKPTYETPYSAMEDWDSIITGRQV
jgi:hypothetical protein